MTFAELTRNYPYIYIFAGPISRGRIKGKANSRRLDVWLSHALAKPNSWKFDCCVWSLLPQTKAELGSIGQYQYLAVAKSAAGKGECPKVSHRELNQNQTEILWYPSPAGPGAAGVVALYKLYTITMTNNIQLSQDFREFTITFANSKNTFARVPNITCRVFAIETPYKDL